MTLILKLNLSKKKCANQFIDSPIYFLKWELGDLNLKGNYKNIWVLILIQLGKSEIISSNILVYNLINLSSTDWEGDFPIILNIIIQIIYAINITEKLNPLIHVDIQI